MLKITAITAGIITTVIFSGCSTTPKDQKQNIKHIEHAHKNNEKYLETFPDWAKSIKNPDDNGFYAVGIASSEQPHLAIKKSVLQAEFAIAQQIKNEISGYEQLTEEGNSTRVDIDRYVSVVDRLVTKVPLLGIKSVNQKIVSNPATGKFTAFSQLELPRYQFNNVMQQIKSSNSSIDQRIEKYIDNLNKRINLHLSDKNKERQ